MRLKRFSIGFLLLVLVGLFTVLFLQYSYQSYLKTPVGKDSKARIVMTVAQGETGYEIAEKLSGLELIPSKFAFYWYLRQSGLGNQLEAGKYILKKSFTIPEIAQTLTHGKNEEIVLTIREGLSIDQVDTYLTDSGILPAHAFQECAKNCVIEQRLSLLDSKPREQSLEGYLFADTYFADPETVSPKELILKMLKNFESKLTSALRSEIAKRGASIHQIVTMASLIEKESRTSEEKPIIAGILWKRFKEKMALGVDATVRYAVKKWTGQLTLDDLSTNSPYNTRKNAGLPPGPISNFSVDSLKAAIMPKDSPYYYYLHGSDGEIHYAKTNEEHNTNKAKYLN